MMRHPSAERLESFVEGLLDAGDRVVVESHLAGCPACQRETEELRSLFAALARLERFAPPPGFAHRVMLQVRIPEPWYAKASSYLQPIIPRTTRGWALASALLALPVLLLGSLMLWVLSKPYVSGQGLVSFTVRQLWGRFAIAADSVLTAMVQSDVMLAFVRGVQSLLEAGLTGAGLLAAGVAMISAWSTWVLYQNLFRPSKRESNYVTYSF